MVLGLLCTQYLFSGTLNKTTPCSEGSYFKITNDNAVTFGLEHSDIVFLGELISTNLKTQYSFRIVEIFKGSFQNKTIIGKDESGCYRIPATKGLWIVYAKFNNDSTIKIPFDNPSISITEPFYFSPPPPPRNNIPKTSDSLLESRVYSLERHFTGISNWFNDLQKLRDYKRSINIVNNKPIRDYKFILLMASLIINVLMFLIIIFKIRKKQ